MTRRASLLEFHRQNQLLHWRAALRDAAACGTCTTEDGACSGVPAFTVGDGFSRRCM